MERNNMFKYATKELSQDAFICWLVNYINTDEEEYKVVAKEFIKLIADKIGNVKFMQYVKDNNYKVEIKHQYKNIDVLLKINNFYIIIEDKIKTVEHDDQINKYTYSLLQERYLENRDYEFIKNGGIEELGEFNIFTCYYKIYDEYKSKDKFVNALITRKDMINLLENVQNKNLYMEDYYKYLKEIEEYSKKRDITTNKISELKSDIVDNLSDSIYTSFYSELEEKEGSNDIIGWGYADNRAGGTWWYASKKFKNVESEEFDKVYAELNLKDNRNEIVIKLAKKTYVVELREDEKIEDVLKDEEYYENGKIKYFDRSYYYKSNEKRKLEKMTTYICYKNLKYKVDIFDKVITDEFLNKLARFDIHLNNNQAKGKIKKDNNLIYKYYTRIASINVNNYTLEEIEEILDIINNHLQKLKVKF